MSEPLRTLQARAAEERIAEAITNTSRKLDSLRTSLPELKSKFEHKRDAFNADAAASGKPVFPAEAQGAIKACEDEITSLDGSLTKLRAEQDAARAATKATDAKKRQAAEYADLVELCIALRPAVVINNRLKLAHDAAGSIHRSLALPWLDDEMISGLEFYAKAQTALPARKPLPRGSANVIFKRSFPGSQSGSTLGSLCSYRENEVANFPRRIVDALVAANYATEVAP